MNFATGYHQAASELKKRRYLQLTVGAIGIIILISTWQHLDNRPLALTPIVLINLVAVIYYRHAEKLIKPYLLCPNCKNQLTRGSTAILTQPTHNHCPSCGTDLRTHPASSNLPKDKA